MHFLLFYLVKVGREEEEESSFNCAMTEETPLLKADQILRESTNQISLKYLLPVNINPSSLMLFVSYDLKRKMKFGCHFCEQWWVSPLFLFMGS